MNCCRIQFYRIVSLLFISVIRSFYLSALLCPLSVSLWPSHPLIYLPFPYFRSYLFILSILFCPSLALPLWCECFSVPLTCWITCKCVSHRHQGLALGSLSQAEGITLTFRAGRRRSSSLMCWREAQPRACCSKADLIPSLPGLFTRMPIHFQFNSWIWFEVDEFDKIEWNVNNINIEFLIKHKQ